MTPVTRNLTIYRGDTFQIMVRLRSKDEFGEPGDYLDITGCTPLAQIRATTDAGAPTATFDCEITDALSGEVTITLEPAVTSSLTTAGVWDFQLTWPEGTVSTYLAGSVTVIKDVTRV